MRISSFMGFLKGKSVMMILDILFGQTGIM
ncbi:hypothetical protein [Clostridium sporogenes]